MRAEQKSLTNHFEIIDVLIQDGQLRDAVSELKKAEKLCYDSWSYIGLYKRYSNIGENKAAEKVLEKALKKNSQNPELLAIYSNHLVREERYEEAVKAAEPLISTKYGSIYSEAVLRQLNNEKNQIDLKEIKNTSKTSNYYKDSKYYTIYYDAYKSTKNPMWIKDCAIFHLKEGYFDNAASLLPGEFATVDDAYFWALVLYDAGKYYEAIHALEIAKLYEQNFANSSKKSKINTVQIAALESDAYLGACDAENAENQRKTIINQIEQLKDLSTEDDELLAMLLVNSAIYAKNNNEFDKTADLLLYGVNRWPYNTSALLLYTDFAYDSNQERDEDEEQKSLRKAGITSIEMEKFDSRTRIPLSDALYRLDFALKEKNDSKLAIKKLDLKYKLESNFTEKEKIGDLWKTLEQSFNKLGKYDSLLVQYSLTNLLKTQQYDDAFLLYQKTVNNLYGIELNEEFWNQLVKSMPLMDVKLVEFGAWFASYKHLYEEALRLYQFCVYESSGIISDGAVSQYATVQACMNLADIYYSDGRKSEALELYGKAAGRESSKYLRSEIFYRIACIYMATGDNKNALRSADYAAVLYPENARANLLISKLK